MRILEKAVLILKKVLKSKWPLIIVAFVLLFYILSILYVTSPPTRERARDARRMADIRIIQDALEINYSQNGVYPDAVGNYLPEDLQGETYSQQDPKGDYYIYKTVRGKTGYRIGICLEEKTYSTGLGNCPANLDCKNYFCVTQND